MRPRILEQPVSVAAGLEEEAQNRAWPDLEFRRLHRSSLHVQSAVLSINKRTLGRGETDRLMAAVAETDPGDDGDLFQVARSGGESLAEHLGGDQQRATPFTRGGSVHEVSLAERSGSEKAQFVGTTGIAELRTDLKNEAKGLAAAYRKK